MEERINKQLKKSKEIYDKAIEKFDPDATISMVSGGNDSAVAYHVLDELNALPDYIFHINTRTGVKLTTEFVRGYYGNLEPIYIEPDAGSAYARYVLRKGFFGRGYIAHTYAYHVLKQNPMAKAISKHIRKGKRGVKVLLFNGARKSESENRKINLPDVYNWADSTPNNIWANIIHHWTKEDCDYYLKSRDIPINPVTKKLCRSAECLCGTMQKPETRIEVANEYPEWGGWIDKLRNKVMNEDPKYPWDWGYEMPDWYKDLMKGQMGLFGEHEEYDHAFQPMCIDCKVNQNPEKQ